MAETGVLRPDARVELLNGQIIDKSPIGPFHGGITKYLNRLFNEAAKLGDGRPAIVRVEGLYTFPEDTLKAVLARYSAAREVVWAQEEPRNMGAWSYAAPKVVSLLQSGQVLRYSGRPERASPAEGYPMAHAAEQARIVAEALHPMVS